MYIADGTRFSQILKQNWDGYKCNGGGCHVPHKLHDVTDKCAEELETISKW